MPLDELAIRQYEPTPPLLEGRVILITGAGDGIGRAVSLACAAHGATVILLGKTVKKLEAVYDEIESQGGLQPAIYPMNLEGATAKDYADLTDNIAGEFGQLHGLVNNAGWIGALTPFKHYDVELWAKVMAVNLHAPFLLTRACLPLLERAEDPAIVFSTHHCQRAYWGGYGIAKAGQKGMLDILAAEYDAESNHPMRVNGIDTGPVITRERRAHYPGEKIDAHPKPEAMVGPYLYFLGPDSRGITGTDFECQPGKL
ncbi:3-oxoacyl-ACP reductase [Acidihalobacter aeolianus]|uniref:3-oxoacyl-ACP reductase n=1 Tax=Acidihalobacter aeolianus TaxID=2792603 RepID=A0A1D8K8E6_9GAMM|nr:SDR family NAD(P)-dependent oxidoreductase [Acidihalobacter aeolianus]AOV17213.1 3-oxoacyl-ACP reductase [Acidihalobacter aeolianus]